MVGKTAPIRRSDRERFRIIREYCGCLPCLLRGHLDRHTSIEHVTSRGQRVGEGSSQHEATIGLCEWHHFAVCIAGQQRHQMEREFGPSLALGRRPFEEVFGDERLVLIPVQDYMILLFDADPWLEYNVPRRVVRRVRQHWINLNALRSRSRGKFRSGETLHGRSTL